MIWEPVYEMTHCPTQGTAVYRTQFPDTLSECLPLRGLLHTDELERMDRFKVESATIHYLQTRALLRIVLCHHLKCSNLELKLHYSHSKKPFIAPDRNSNLQFNATHTAQWGGVAITDLGEIGLDFEAHNPARDLPSIARRHFSLAEQAAIDALPAEARVAAFFDTWTAKEACVKASGEGITADLQAFTVQLGPPGPLRHVDLPGIWSLWGLPMPHGVSAALAIRNAAPEPVLFDVSLDFLRNQADSVCRVHSPVPNQ